ncbi:hypothetical protein HY989_03430 [Candidatus Micrarchaeota archaeon]|nr:hypothetical protein [Candidatus Micrarchaeota archaeon]
MKKGIKTDTKIKQAIKELFILVLIAFPINFLSVLLGGKEEILIAILAGAAGGILANAIGNIREGLSEIN